MLSPAFIRSNGLLSKFLAVSLTSEPPSRKVCNLTPGFTPAKHSLVHSSARHYSQIMEIDGRVELSGQGGWHPETVSGQLGTASAVYIEHPESQEPSAKKCDHRSRAKRLRPGSGYVVFESLRRLITKRGSWCVRRSLTCEHGRCLLSLLVSGAHTPTGLYPQLSPVEQRTP